MALTGKRTQWTLIGLGLWKIAVQVFPPLAVADAVVTGALELAAAVFFAQKVQRLDTPPLPDDLETDPETKTVPYDPLKR